MLDDPFRPILETLAHLEQEDPKLASQAARLLGLFRRVWESALSKHTEILRLERANQALRDDNVQLCHEGRDLHQRQSDQLARLRLFEQGLERTRQGLLSVLEGWNSYSTAELSGLGEEGLEGH